MILRPAAFAIPGDIATLTGGYIYERRLLEELRAAGREVSYIPLGSSYPDPTPDHLAEAVAKLCAVGPERALILDGFISGATETVGLADVRAPMVAIVHHPLALETGLTEARRAHLFQTERDNLTLMAHVLVPSPHTASILGAQYDVPSDRITVVRPGTERPSEPQAPSDPPLILSVGIRHPRKGHDVLLHALARLGDLDWRAVIVGGDHDPAHSASLDALCLSLGLQGRVRFAGRVSQDALAEHYRAASIFALATRYEGYGLVFDEALSRGLPIVSCRTGAVADTIPPDAGLLVPPDEPKAFADALRCLLTDTDRRRRISAASETAGRDLPDWSAMASVAGAVLDRLA